MRGKVSGLWYWGLFAVESAGMAYLLSIGVPIYRKLFEAAREDRPAKAYFVPVLCVVAVMQVCYWIKCRYRPSPARAQHPVASHLLLFFSRLSFIFAGSLLSLTLFRRLTDLHKALPGVLVLLLTTFAQFCYSRELETLSRRVEGPSDAATRL